MLGPFHILILKNIGNSREENNLQQQLLVIRDLEIMEINKTKLSHYSKAILK